MTAVVNSHTEPKPQYSINDAGGTTTVEKSGDKGCCGG